MSTTTPLKQRNPYSGLSFTCIEFSNYRGLFISTIPPLKSENFQSCDQKCFALDQNETLYLLIIDTVVDSHLNERKFNFSIKSGQSGVGMMKFSHVVRIGKKSPILCHWLLFYRISGHVHSLDLLMRRSRYGKVRVFENFRFVLRNKFLKIFGKIFF
jgi:hypothetical protein